VEYVVLIVLVIGMGLAWWWLSRRRRALLGGDEPPEEPVEAGPPEVFTREALVNRSRRFDPGAWDDNADASSPAATEPGDPDELPTHLDRDYLERRNRPAVPPEPAVPGPPPPGTTPPVATPPAAAAPLPPWPTTPPEADEAEDDLPRYFDREYLERRARRNETDPPEAGA